MYPCMRDRRRDHKMMRARQRRVDLYTHAHRHSASSQPERTSLYARVDDLVRVRPAQRARYGHIHRIG